MATYEVTHRTEYRYETDVSDSYSQLHVLPRNLPGQRCRSAEVTVDPTPEDTANGSTISATECPTSRSTAPTAP